MDAGSPKQYDEKNIRRRVYDALNVLMAMDIIAKHKKEILWRGLPHNQTTALERLKSERSHLANHINKQRAYIQVSYVPSGGPSTLCHVPVKRLGRSIAACLETLVSLHV